MIIKSEQSLSNFEFWSGAKTNAEQLTEKELDNIENVLEELYPEGLEETELNDLFRFEFERVCELAGVTYDPDSGEVER